MLAKQSLPRRLDPSLAHPRLAAGPLLERSEEPLFSPVKPERHETPNTRRVTRDRRAGYVALGQVDQLPAPEQSLAEHLSRQLRMGRHHASTLALGNWIIGNLDPNGYLRDDLSELAAVAGVPVADLERALTIVQSLEPTGVGARSLRECLLLQLRGQDDPDPVAVQLVDAHLHALADKRYDAIARTIGESSDRLMQALAAIRRLEPRPGRPFGGALAQTVRPDVAIEKAGTEYRVVLRDDDARQPRVSQQRWAEASSQRGEVRACLAHHLGVASAVLTAVERRRQTMRGVVESIVRRQRDFLDHGPTHLRPLSFREVAGEVGVHESTVSRAVTHRYVDTPHGVLPLRSFFTNRLPGDPAGVVSPLAARQRIREVVDAEDPSRPLADSKIAGALATSGIRIARRTVVKYRELLGIARATARRSLSA